MIARYTLPEMGAIWSPENKFQKWLDVEIAVGINFPIENALREEKDARVLDWKVYPNGLIVKEV